MGLEASVVKSAKDVSEKGVRAVDTSTKKAWSILDAASEKKPPSEYLSKKAISSIRGE